MEGLLVGADLHLRIHYIFSSGDSRRLQIPSQGVTACLPAVALAKAGAAVDSRFDGWEAVIP
jgi:hypothetical protein